MAPISGRESAHVTKFNSITFGEGEFLHQKALGKNRTHDQDPPSSSLDRYFFDVELQYKLQYLCIIPLAAFKIIEMTQQLDSKEFHFCFKILEKKKHEKQ